MRSIFQFVSTNYLSGLENVVLNISILLRDKYNFTYVSPKGPIDYYLSKYNINHVVVNKLTPIATKNVIKKYHPDIVHGHDVKASLCLSLNSRLCHMHNIKVISELHNDDPRMHCISLRSILYGMSTHNYDDIIVVYKSVLSNYIFKRSIINKTNIINNIVNPMRIPNYDSSPKKWDCIFIGRFVDQKNPMKFVKIISLLKKYNSNVSAIMLGNGPLFNKVRSLVHQFNLGNNIHMMGFCRNPYKYLYKSKILVMPSKYEGLSLTAIESLLCGIPIVASKVNGFRDVLNNQCGYLALSTLDFVKGINHIIKSNHIYNMISSNALKRGRQINNVNLFMKSYEKIYNN